MKMNLSTSRFRTGAIQDLRSSQNTWPVGLKWKGKGFGKSETGQNIDFVQGSNTQYDPTLREQNTLRTSLQKRFIIFLPLVLKMSFLDAKLRHYIRALNFPDQPDQMPKWAFGREARASCISHLHR